MGYLLSSQVCLVMQGTAASYGVGAVGSVVYLRMLNRSIDSVGGFSVGSAVSQPRLLVPVILTATFNRSAHCNSPACLSLCICFCLSEAASALHTLFGCSQEPYSRSAMHNHAPSNVVGCVLALFSQLELCISTSAALEVRQDALLYTSSSLACQHQLLFSSGIMHSSFGAVAMHSLFIMLTAISCRSLHAVHAVGLLSSADRQSLQDFGSTLGIRVLIGLCCCRWNTLAAHDVGITLQLLPMLLGFFTYKAAVIAKTGLSLLESISRESSKAATPDASQPSLQQADAPTAARDQQKSLDATYNQRVLTR